MRYILILVFLSLILFAKESQTCYSVQLASFYKDTSGYTNISRYPETCELMNVANLKAVRCGCYESRTDGIVELKSLRKKYRSATLVRTYKFRFKKTPFTSYGERKVAKKEIVEDTTAKVEESTLSEKEEEEQSADEYVSVEDVESGFFKDAEFNVQGHVDLNGQRYLNKPDGKHASNTLASARLEFDFKKDNLNVIASIYAQQDYFDTKGSSEQNKRSFIRLDELYATYDFEEDQIMAGKSIRFWGALELKNIVDVFNPQDLRSDPFKDDKLGVWNTAYTHYTDSGEFSVIVKVNEQNRKMSSYPYVYYYFPANVSYDETIKTEDGRNRPSIYIKYSGSTDTEYALDYSIIFENGYDSQRYFKVDGLGGFKENAYIVNKLMTYNTLVVGSTLIKFEGVYTDVKDTQSIPTKTGNKSISDYYHIGFGIEHTLSQVHKDADLGLIAEYYKYGTVESSNDHLNDLELFEALQNDLFLGMRYSFNEGNDASIVGGVIFDLDYDEQAYYIEYESRINDMFKLNLDYRYIEPSDNDLTVYNLLERHQRISINLGYYF